ncbi:hypothetical protein SKAU_G00405340 [Synaphobranchus kaupii]|uniref:Uncharacterized protein n=1 Tax=Synaphobranchus kaupii TaxID=118154 RepID=A0A9Q1E9X3_SYNKA|nr:hypothetical protein SKAU_G00405340 [Synaphobranchus kaupii]
MVPWHQQEACGMRVSGAAVHGGRVPQGLRLGMGPRQDVSRAAESPPEAISGRLDEEDRRKDESGGQRERKGSFQRSLLSRRHGGPDPLPPPPLATLR